MIPAARPFVTRGELMLRYVTSTLSACALAGTAIAFAQAPAPSQPPPEQAKPAAETLTGCVQEAKTTDGATAYVLSKVQGASSPMYVLNGPPASELASHVNHKVEVTGQVQQPAPPAQDAPANPKVLRPPLVQVESVKMVAESCN
jgi:hypothetical protein